MRTALFLIANGIAGFQDLAVGAGAVALVGYVFQVEVSLPMLLVGALLGVLPDLFDVVPQILIGRPPKKGEDHHLTFFHRPLYMIPLVTFFGLLADTFFSGQYLWTLIAPLLVTYHYIHDTWAGIAWLYPFKREYPIPFRGWVAPEKCGNTPGHRIWIDQYWFYGSVFAIREVFIGSIALTLGAFLTYGLSIGLLALLVPLILTLAYWGITKTLAKRNFL